MVTLISWATSGGDTGRCDAKCYSAAEDECDCCCAGLNHGAGREQAEQNTRELAEGWIEAEQAKAASEGREAPVFYLGDAATHEPLFDMPEQEAEAG
jgi:predicted RNase H-like HicB family nuclease